MNYDGGYSLSDIAAATGNSNNNNGGFGEGYGSWWIIIFLIFAFMGWGRNGFGGNNGGNGTDGIGTNYVLASDFATIQRQLDNGFDRVATGVNSVNQGICDGFYAMNTGMLNGFGNVQQTLCQGFAGVNSTIVQNGYENRIATQGLSSQLADCCCKTQSSIADLGYRLQDCCCTTQRAIDGVNYNMAMNTNNIQQTLCNNTRDLIENQNANYRALHDEIVANRIEDKNAQIQAQQNEINALRLAASQAKQNNYLIDQLKPCPIPAYITCNPYQSYGFTYPTNGCGCNSGCGC